MALMIKAMAGLIFKNLRDVDGSDAILHPITSVWIDDRHRPTADGMFQFQLQCQAMVWLYGGEPNQPVPVSAVIRGPDVVETEMPSAAPYRWPARDRTFALFMSINVPIPVYAGGLYELVIKTLDQTIITLPFFVLWKSELYQA